MAPPLTVSRAILGKALEGEQSYWSRLPAPLCLQAEREGLRHSWLRLEEMRTGDSDDRPLSQAAASPRVPRKEALRGPNASDDRSVWETRNQGLNMSSSSDCYRVVQFLKIRCLFLFMMVKITRSLWEIWKTHKSTKKKTGRRKSP